MTACSLASWSLDTAKEPMIRIGVVLPDDNMPALRLEVPDRAYRMGAGWSGDGDVRAAAVEVHASGDTIAWCSGILGGGPAKVLRLTPVEPPPSPVGAGLSCTG